MFSIDVDDSLRLIGFIKGMQRKGFNEDEIRDRLLNVGWSTSAVEKFLRKEVLNSDFEGDGEVAIKMFAKYGRFLLKDESIESIYKAGVYKLVLTNKRLLILKKFPKNVSEHYFKDIELAEYYTSIEYVRALYAFFYFIGFIFFLVYHSTIVDMLVSLLPVSAGFFKFKPLFGLDIGTLLIAGYLLVYFIIDLVEFLLSFVGRLRILPKHVGPTEIISRFTPDVEEFLSKIDMKLEKDHQEE